MEEVVDYLEEPEEKLDSGSVLPTQTTDNNTEKVVPLVKKPDTMQRNKRLFGALMGHLDSAKRILERDATKIDKQVQTKTVAAEKHQQQSRVVAELFNKIKETEQKKV